MTTVHFNDILKEVMEELRTAVAKHPNWPADPFHALAILGEEYGELQQAILQRVYEDDKNVSMDDIRKEAVQTAAMAIRFLVSLPAYSIERTKTMTTMSRQRKLVRIIRARAKSGVLQGAHHTEWANGMRAAANILEENTNDEDQETAMLMHLAAEMLLAWRTLLGGSRPDDEDDAEAWDQATNTARKLHAQAAKYA